MGIAHSIGGSYVSHHDGKSTDRTATGLSDVFDGRSKWSTPLAVVGRYKKQSKPNPNNLSVRWGSGSPILSKDVSRNVLDTLSG
jgi:hypothetical protein